MPTIPRAENVSRVIPTGQQVVSSQDPRYADGGFGALAEAARDILDQRTQYQVAQAEAEFLTLKAKQDTAYDQDDDYNTIPERYSESLESGLENVADLIQHPTARQAFLQQAQVTVERGRQRIKQVAFQKERDYQRGYIAERLTGLREAGLTGDPTVSFETARTLLDGAVGLGYYSEEEKAQVLQRWRDDMLVGRVEMMPPEERVTALSQPWAEKIPSDVRAKLLREAEGDQRKATAITTVDSYFDQDLDFNGALAQIRQIEDPKLREEVERRYTNEFNRVQVAKAQEQDELHHTYYSRVREGEITIDDIPEEDFERMSQPVQQSLYAAENQYSAGRSGGAPQHSDLSVLDTLYQYKAAEDWVGLREYFRANAHKLDPTDAKYWSETSVNGVMSPETEYALTAFQNLDSQLAVALGPDAESGELSYRNKLMRQQYKSWFENYKAMNEGKAPTEAEQQQWIDSQFVEMATGYSEGVRLPTQALGVFGLTIPDIQLTSPGPRDEKPWALMEPDEKLKAVETVQRHDPAAARHVMEVMNVNNLSDLDPDEFYEAYRLVKYAAE